MQNQDISSREAALQILAIEIDKALRIGPIIHIKHKAVPQAQYGLACLESHLLGNRNGQMYSLHEWGHYDEIKATSIIFPEAPRGFTITLKTDSMTENKLRGNKNTSIPKEAKTLNYIGDYIKIDWIYPSKEIQGLGIPRHYFYAVERGAKAAGYPSLHIDATDNGLSYWARKEFDLKIPTEKHAGLVDAYKAFKAHPHTYIQQASRVYPHINAYHEGDLPEDIDPSKPYTIPRTFMDLLGVIFMIEGRHLHFYKKFS